MRIPPSSISRLSLYYKALLSVQEADLISSQELADITRCSAAQIRKDLTYFGQFGTRGRGYFVEVLKKELKKILGIDKPWDVCLVGVGNLGSALLAYKGFKTQGFNIKYGFDNDTKKIGKVQRGVRVNDIKEFKKIIHLRKINIAIVAVPQEVAQDVIEGIVDSGVKAILNFAPIIPKVPKGVEVLNIDLSMELERLTYFLSSKG